MIYVLMTAAIVIKHPKKYTFVINGYMIKDYTGGGRTWQKKEM